MSRSRLSESGAAAARRRYAVERAISRAKRRTGSWDQADSVSRQDERSGERLDEIVKNRSMSDGGGDGRRKRVRVFRARIVDFEEVEVVPARRIGPELRPIEAVGFVTGPVENTDGEVVAQLCTGCDTQLPVEWGGRA